MMTYEDLIKAYGAVCANPSPENIERLQALYESKLVWFGSDENLLRYRIVEKLAEEHKLAPLRAKIADCEKTVAQLQEKLGETLKP